jgi:hypothetical protein
MPSLKIIVIWDEMEFIVYYMTESMKILPPFSVQNSSEFEDVQKNSLCTEQSCSASDTSLLFTANT